jgi:hypothetical protein
MGVVSNELHFGRNRKDKQGLWWCLRFWGCWVLTVEYRLSNVECGLCQMNCILEKTGRKSRVCSGTLASEDVDCWLLIVDCWFSTLDSRLLIVDYRLLTIDCRMLNGSCVKWTAFWEKQEGKTGSVMVSSLVRTADCPVWIVDCWLSTLDCRLLTVECMLWDMNFGSGKGWVKTLSVMVLSLVRSIDCWLLTVYDWLLTID